MKYTLTYIIAAVVLILIRTELIKGADFMDLDDFPPIVLPAISNQSDLSENSAVATLYTSGDAEISADNSGAAQLSFGVDDLVTEYKLAFDGDGASATGGTPTSYEAYDSFLTTAAAVTHVADDNEAEITLYVRASNPAGEVADAGAYIATQTLTVHWTGAP